MVSALVQHFETMRSAVEESCMSAPGEMQKVLTGALPAAASNENGRESSFLELLNGNHGGPFVLQSLKLHWWLGSQGSRLSLVIGRIQT